MNYWERILWSEKLGPSKFPWPCLLTKVIGPMGWKPSQNIDPLLASVFSSTGGLGSWSPKGLRIFVPTTDLLGSNVVPSDAPICIPPGLATYSSPSSLPAPLLGFAMRDPSGWDQALVTGPGRGAKGAGKHHLRLMPPSPYPPPWAYSRITLDWERRKGSQSRWGPDALYASPHIIPVHLKGVVVYSRWGNWGLGDCVRSHSCMGLVV